MHWRVKKSNILCYYKFSNGVIIKAKALDVSQMHEPIYGTIPAFFVICPVAVQNFNHNVKLPEYIRVTDKDFQSDFQSEVESDHFVAISYPKFDAQTSNEENSIAICPGPAHNTFSNALRIAEFVEFYKILGVTKFYFYNMSISHDVDKIFKYYESQNIVDVQQWNIADVMNMDEGTIHYYGIMAALNDCFYRATAIDNFKYVIIADFDEIIHPLHTHDKLTDFIAAHDNPSFHSLLFSNYFVFVDFPPDFSSTPKNAINKYLYTQSQVIRMKHTTGDHKWFHVRTKLVAKRDVVTEVGNHYIWTALDNTKEFKIDPKDAAMFHYRDDCIKGYCDKETVKDFSMRKYGDELWKAVDATCSVVFSNGICPRNDDK